MIGQLQIGKGVIACFHSVLKDLRKLSSSKNCNCLKWCPSNGSFESKVAALEIYYFHSHLKNSMAS